MTRYHLTPKERTACRQAADLLLYGGPHWDRTPEGRVFWGQVHIKLDAMAMHGTFDGQPQGDSDERSI